MTLEELVNDLIVAAKETHKARIAYVHGTHPDSVEYKHWYDMFIDRSVRLSVAVERLERFGQEGRANEH